MPGYFEWKLLIAKLSYSKKHTVDANRGNKICTGTTLYKEDKKPNTAKDYYRVYPY
jgi:hypothetical protein